MINATVFPAGDSPALGYAARFLSEQGVKISADNATHILLDVPVREQPTIPLAQGVTVIGGNLDFLPPAFPRADLMQDETFVAENAHLTADCTVRLLCQHLPCAFRDCPVLIIGWGRIGKCLAAMLKALDARVTVAARKETDRGLLRALGYTAIPAENIDPTPYRAIINTAPAPVLDAGAGLRIDLASRQGIGGENVIWARGLPGKMLPESKGKVIAQAVLRYLEGKKL